MLKILPTIRSMSHACGAVALVFSLAALSACDDKAEGGEAKPAETQGAAEAEEAPPPVPTDAELDKEAEAAVTADNADAVADALAKELEAELAE